MAYFRKNGVVVDDAGGIVSDQGKLTEAAGGAQGTARAAAFSKLPEYAGDIKAGAVTIPTIKSTPSVISSKDYASQFQDDGTFVEGEANAQTLAADSYKEAQEKRNKALEGYDQSIADTEKTETETYNKELRGIKSETEATLSLLGDQFAWAKGNYSQMYDRLIKQTERLAEISVDRRKAYGASSAQYDPMGFTAGITEEMSKWNGEIGRLQGEKASAIQEAQLAYREGRAGALAEQRKNIAAADAAMKTAIKQAGERLRESLEIYEAQVAGQQEAAKANAETVASLILRKHLDDYENGDETSRETLIDEAFKEAGLRASDYSLREAVSAVDEAILKRNKQEYDDEMQRLNLIDKNQDIENGKDGGGGGTITSGGLKVSKTELGEMASTLESSRGEDGFVNTELYVDAFSDWVSGRGLAKDFFSQFDPDLYVNPGDDTLPPNIKRAMSKKEEDPFDSI